MTPYRAGVFAAPRAALSRGIGGALAGVAPGGIYAPMPFAAIRDQWRENVAAYLSCRITRTDAALAGGRLRANVSRFVGSTTTDADRAESRTWVLPPASSVSCAPPAPATSAATRAHVERNLPATEIELTWTERAALAVDDALGVSDVAELLSKPLFNLGSFEVKAWQLGTVAALALLLGGRR